MTTALDDIIYLISSNLMHHRFNISPPGTGKTTLNKALAQKLAIRLSDRFPRSTLLEIHSHSLFSKWFSTSGKLVSALFSMVRDMVEDDPHCLVCVLIDEVESLASSRSQQQGGDPSDAMRAVNSLLTSLDRLKSFPNVMVLATTNLTGQIDAAFVDRVDLKLHINVPIFRARYEILRTCLEELVRVGIVIGPRRNETDNSSAAMSTEYANKELFVDFIVAEKEERERIDGDESGMLLSCSRDADGLSGRSLRRVSSCGTLYVFMFVDSFVFSFPSQQKHAYVVPSEFEILLQ